MGYAGRDVIAKPSGVKTVKGSVTTTSTYQDVGDCKHVVTKNKVFKLTKISASCSEDVMVKIVFGTEDISIEYYIMAKLPFTDWLPEGWNKDRLIGDGSKEIKIQAKYPTGGTSATVYSELSGEEV